MIKRELGIFLILFVFLSLSMHFHAWMTEPMKHLRSLPESSLGIYHPLYLTFGIYLIILIVRAAVYLVKKVLKKG